MATEQAFGQEDIRLPEYLRRAVGILDCSSGTACITNPSKTWTAPATPIHVIAMPPSKPGRKKGLPTAHRLADVRPFAAKKAERHPNTLIT
jgi:hypothetical protein